MGVKRTIEIVPLTATSALFRVKEGSHVLAAVTVKDSDFSTSTTSKANQQAAGTPTPIVFASHPFGGGHGAGMQMEFVPNNGGTACTIRCREIATNQIIASAVMKDSDFATFTSTKATRQAAQVIDPTPIVLVSDFGGSQEVGG